MKSAMTTSATMVEVRDLKVRFARGASVVRAVNGYPFELDAGEVLTVIGESGSGKSVMLRALLGLNHPTPSSRAR